MLERIAYNLVQVLVVLAFSPLVEGVAARLKEIIQSKRGPSIFQPYRDIWKLLHKDEIVSEYTTWIFRTAPYIAFAAPVFVALLIPVLTRYPLFFAFMGDMLGGGFVLALGGFSPHSPPSIRQTLTVLWGQAARAWWASSPNPSSSSSSWWSPLWPAQPSLKS